MDKNEAILKSYRFLSPSIMTTGRKGRKIDIAVKAKAGGGVRQAGLLWLELAGLILIFQF